MPARIWILVAGIAVGICSHPYVSGGTVIALAVLCAFALLIRRHLGVTLAATLLLAGAAGWTVAALNNSDGAALRERAESFPRCSIDGRVLEHLGGLGTLIAVDSADCAPSERATVVTQPQKLAAGATIRAEGWLQPLDDDGFERARARTGADAGFIIDSFAAGHVRGRAHRAAASFRASLKASTDHLPTERVGLILGMTIGDTSDLPSPTEEELRRAGLTHLLAVSGSNVAIVLGIVALSLRRMSLPVRVAAGGLALAFYVLIVGPEPSVVRAGAMGAIALIALWRGATTETLNLLGLALVVVLLLRPGILYSPGLHLSAAATAGIVVWAGRIADRLDRLPRPLALALGATIAAQLAVSPVLLATFGEISLIAPLANVLAFPVVAPITIIGLGAGALSLVAPAPAAALMSLLSPLAGWVVEVGHRTGSTHWASASLPRSTAVPMALVVVWLARRTLRRAPSAAAESAARDRPEPDRHTVDAGARDDAPMADWHWKLHDAQGRDLRATEAFSSKEEAEAWLGGQWQALANEGADSVSLVEGDKVSYKMSLQPE